MRGSMKILSFVKEDTLCWTLTSNGYKYMTWNFALHWQTACPGVPLLVVCADKPSQQFLSREGIRCVLWDNALADYGPQIVPFGSRQFSTLNRLKLTLLDTFAKDETIQKCLYFDGDIAVYKNVAEDLKTRLDEQPLWMQCDEQLQDCTAKSQEPFTALPLSTKVLNGTATDQQRCPNTCTGVIAFKHGADGGIFKITDQAVWAQKPEDQVWVNYAATQLNIPVAVLPRELYPNGARLSLTKKDAALMETVCLLHYNYRVGDSKKADMKRFGDWLLPY